MLARRLAELPRATVFGCDVPVAATPLSRLLGLACLDRAHAGAGLLIPRCASVHTFGMRFPLDLFFLDRRGAIVDVRRRVPARRVISRPGTAAVLEIPAGVGGEISAPRP